MAQSEKIRTIFENHDFHVRPIETDRPHENGFAERPQQDFGRTIRAVLYGADMPASFWDYAAHHIVLICNLLVRKGKTACPITNTTGHIPRMNLIQIWGPRIDVKKTGK